MEQTKAKTAEEILCKYLGEYWWIMGKYRRPAINAAEKFAHQKTIELQSHIANLEAEKAQLERLFISDQKSIESLEKQVLQYQSIVDSFIESPENVLLAKVRNLEAQNKELREALEKIKTLAQSKRGAVIPDEITSIAKQALKKDKQDG